MELKLVVIRTDKLSEMVDFYGKLGIAFDYHQHGNGVFHYACSVKNTTFEIYPLQRGQQTPDTSTRLGFSIQAVDTVLSYLLPEQIVKPLQSTEWGMLAIVKDPDGRKIELYQS